MIASTYRDALRTIGRSPHPSFWCLLTPNAAPARCATDLPLKSPRMQSDRQEQLLRDTEAYLHEQIPITKAMDIRIDSYHADKFVVTAPLAPNHNHLGTAFGGSLAAIATLAGYGLLWLELGDRSAHLVIRDSQLLYLRPVRKRIRAICHRPTEAEIQMFKSTFAQAGKARITLRATIEEDEHVAVRFEGTFVAMRA